MSMFLTVIAVLFVAPIAIIFGFVVCYALIQLAILALEKTQKKDSK